LDSDHTGVIVVVFVEEAEIFFEEVIDLGSFIWRKNGLADSEGYILLAGEVGLVCIHTDEYTFKFFIYFIAIAGFEGISVSREPAVEYAEGYFAARGYAEGFQELFKREKIYFVTFIAVVIGGIELLRVFDEEGGKGDIEDSTAQGFDFFEGKGGFSASGRADNNHGWWEAEYGILVIIEGYDLIEEVEISGFGVHIRQREKIFFCHLLGFGNRE
jgi:hypothetical protein